MEPDQPAVPELRHALARLTELRVAESGTPSGGVTITGYAAVFDSETTLFDAGWLRMREIIRRGAFADVLSRNPDVHLVLGHDMNRAMARTGLGDVVGGLELTEDARGLRVFARVDPDVSYIADTLRLMRSGVIDQMSFAFTIGDQRRTETEDADGNVDVLREILTVGELYDVTITPQGAYPQTTVAASARTAVREELAPLLADITRRADQAGAPEHVAHSAGGSSDVAPEAGVDPHAALKRRARAIRARAAL